MKSTVVVITITVTIIIISIIIVIIIVIMIIIIRRTSSPIAASGRSQRPSRQEVRAQVGLCRRFGAERIPSNVVARL